MLAGLSGLSRAPMPPARQTYSSVQELPTAMWPTIERTRRRLQGEAAAEPTADAIVVVDGEGIPATTTVVLSLGRPEFDRLGQALLTRSGPGAVRPDTPARLEAALATLIADVGGDHGRARVVRRPAGLTTPEAWQVRLTDVLPAVVDAIGDAIRGGPAR
jgi:hypothetical protein